MDNLFLFEKSSFITELSEEKSPGHLDQLEIFYEDTEKLFDSISEKISSSQLAVTYATVRPNEFGPPAAGEPSGYLLHWPAHQSGLSTIIRSDGEGQQNSLQAVFPFSCDGTSYLCRLVEIILFNNRLEAQLKVMAGENEELELTFYDSHYLADRVVYREAGVYQFILRAFAYFFEAQAVSADDDGLWALFNRSELGADHYEVHGPVRSVTGLSEPLLGQKTWRVEIVIGRSAADEDQLLDIFLTQKVLGKGRLPAVGDNARAVVWLQGHLWGIPGDNSLPENGAK
jgi:hypothetical protein